MFEVRSVAARCLKLLINFGLLALLICLMACNPPESVSDPRPDANNRMAPAADPAPSRVPSPVPGLLAGQLPNPDAAVTWDPTAGAATGFPAAPDRDLYRLAAELSSAAGDGPIPRVVNPAPVSYAAGRKDRFWIVDFPARQVDQSEFELRLVSPRAYWYVEAGTSVSQKSLERSAAHFEEQIYPRVTAFFGREWIPGVDNDPHLNIVHGRLRGVAGYFSSTDEYSQRVYPFSNQRETIYINSGALRMGSDYYFEVLAHELQHAIHWNGDASEDTWVNEGLSELAVSVAGYRPDRGSRFLSAPTVSLVHWPTSPNNTLAHYGSAALFLHYLAAHYASGDNLIPLVSQPANGIAGINAYLRQAGYTVTFLDLFRDWVIANLLDEDRGPYGYPDLDVEAQAVRLVKDIGEINSSIPQYAAEYLDLTALSGPLRLRFRGEEENQLLPLETGPEGCWWSNAGDSIAASLTRTVDLRSVAQATLQYQVWYDIEENWDYGYILVSVDEGKSWDFLETPHTSLENPIGNSFGVGYTGQSAGWISESIDLEAYAGMEIWLRFLYVTDDAVHGAGLCLRGITVPELGRLNDAASEWQAEGFLLVNNRVKQNYLVQIVQQGPDNRVYPLALDQYNAGEILIEPVVGVDRLIVAVAALASQTRQKARYTLYVESVE